MIPASKKVRLILELRQGGIFDTALLAAMEKVPRDRFVPDAFRDRAYEDTALPISHGQTISQPLVVARMLQAMALHDRVKVLEIGTGSGYQTMILSYLCRRVYTIERHKDLLRGAEARFGEMGRHNITTRAGDGALGWPEQAPFTHIVVSAAANDVPPVLAEQLDIGGVMVVPVGDERRDQRILKVVKTEAGVECEDIGPVRFLPLVAGMPVAPKQDGRAEA